MNVRALNKCLMRRKQPPSDQNQGPGMASASAQPSSLVPEAKAGSVYSPSQSTRRLMPDAWPYLLNNLSIFHVKLDDVHVAEGNNSEGPYHPGPIGIRHLVMDAVTKRGKTKQGATASATGQARPQGSSWHNLAGPK